MKEKISKLVPGLYDAPITDALSTALDALDAEFAAHRAPLDPSETPEILARALAHRLVHALRAVPGGDHDKLPAQLALANEVLALLRDRAPKGGGAPEDAFDDRGEKLLAVVDASQSRLGSAKAPVRPEIALSMSDLLVNGRHDLSVGPEVVREIQSADRVDLLCSFLKWSGLRLVQDALRDLLERRPTGLRILTTAYMGATDRRALDHLAKLGADVRVSYDTERTRLHAKAWFFHRESGFSTAYIGSSNLSAAAMHDGLEWNVRLSQIDNGGILEKFKTTFSQYWADSEFRPYDPARDGATFDAAVKRERRGFGDGIPIAALDVRPRPHQEEILDHLSAERARGHHRNLVVAATGTGKTVIAALDYRRLRSQFANASLLFVAHRGEILKQSLSTFRVALRDGDFGELLVGGSTPQRGGHVFASIQSLHANRLAALPKDAYDVVIVDEFHHAAAPTYERLLSHLEPKVLLGLTATPERADGESVLGWFDGRIASELRLWKALDQGLLSPFQYFGAAGPDISGLHWKRGRYDATALSNVYTGDDVFVKRVLQEIAAKVVAPKEMRALGFCVDVAHARFMADRFTRAGLASIAVTGETPAAERSDALRALREGKLRVLFSVDLFNEGVDLPDVDTVIFLRPTESATLFLQQLGRGLRRSDNKACLTALDFIGGAHRKFRFDQRFRAIVGGTRKGVQRQVERGFPHLPSGCSIQLSRDAQSAVLDNIRASLGLGYRALAADLRELGDIDLRTFLAKEELDVEDVYAGSGRCFTDLRRQAGLETRAKGPADDQLAKALSRMVHIDDVKRLDAFRTFLQQETGPAADPAKPMQRMLFMLLGYVRQPLTEMKRAWTELWSSPLRGELIQLLEVLDDRARDVSSSMARELGALPLRAHATYSLDEIMSGLDERDRKGGIKRIQTGVHYIARLKTDLLFITLEKSEKHYSPTTLYKDYPISAQRFHWESQSSCHAGTKTGKRYIASHRGSGNTVLLFVRHRRTDERGLTVPYLCLGPAHYALHRSGRPMQIEWDLERPMPAGFYQEAKVAAG